MLHKVIYFFAIFLYNWNVNEEIHDVSIRTFTGNEFAVVGEKKAENRLVYVFVLRKISDVKSGLCKQIRKIFIINLFFRSNLR